MTTGARAAFIALFSTQLAAVGCQSTSPLDDASHDGRRVVISLRGQPLAPLTFTAEQRAELEDNLAQARQEYDADPGDEMNIIWLGRRLAYLGRYHAAIDVFSRGIDLHPDSYRLLRHRGHRYITTRQLDKAVADLSRAAALAAGHPDAVEPDGAPNAAGVPTSTTHTNIYYHLGLAHYLQGAFEQALDAYQQCMRYCTNNDITVATTYWLVLTARQLNEPDVALAALERIAADMKLLENHDYHRLLLMFKGELTQGELLGKVESGALSGSTITYGVAMQRIHTGEVDRGVAMLRSTIEHGFWPAFGSIAAEAELARMR